jgi:hypothetical protein
MKKICFWFAKAIVAMAVAFAMITGFCFFYYNVPIHYTPEINVTDYYWDENAISCRATEGFAFTETDENGYVNTYPKSGEDIDILVMGSSHTEGFNVSAKENYTYVLNDLMQKNGLDQYAYNIGTSGHTLSRCFRNLESAVSSFNPKEYVIIETESVNPPLEELKQYHDATLSYLPSHNSGLIHQLQKNDFIRLMHVQLSNALENEMKDDEQQETSEENIGQEEATGLSDETKKYLSRMLKDGEKIATEKGCKLVIVYFPGIEIDYSGKVVSPSNDREKADFRAMCEELRIGFVDMQQPFVRMYETTHQLPRGFSNTKVGVGHINKYGHAEIAKELYRYIAEVGK